MKRREFIYASSGMTAYGILPKNIFANLLMEYSFSSEAYDDNKVVRVYHPKVTNYDFTGSTVYWKTIDQNILEQMLLRALIEVSGEKLESKAWKKIFTGDCRTDLSDKKIAIKVNFNNTIRDIRNTLNSSPAMMISLAKSLKLAGANEKNICFFDCSRPFPQEFKNEIRESGFEKLALLGKDDNLPESGETIFLADNKGFLRGGKTTDQYPIPKILVDTDYLINLHLVKIHQPGVTGAMKNLCGISKEVGFYMHFPNSAPKPKPFSESYVLPDISLNPQIKKRAKLNIAEFIFGGHSPDTIDKFTNKEFFPGGIPASLIVSRSPFYHDTVLYNFIKAEYETCVPVLNRFLSIGPDTWLKKSSERYPMWKYEQGIFKQNDVEGRPSKELYFGNLNYISV